MLDDIDAIPGFVPWFVLQKKECWIRNLAARVSGKTVPDTLMTGAKMKHDIDGIDVFVMVDALVFSPEKVRKFSREESLGVELPDFCRCSPRLHLLISKPSTTTKKSLIYWLTCLTHTLTGLRYIIYRSPLMY